MPPRRNPRRAVRGPQRGHSGPYRPNDHAHRHRLPSHHRKTEQVVTYTRRKPLDS